MKSVEEMYNEVMSINEDESHQIKIEKLDALLAIYPDFAPAHEQLGSIHYQMGNFDSALTHFEKAAQCDPENILIQKNLGDFYYTVLSRNEDALACYQKILAIQPDDTNVILTAANLLVAMHRFAEAEKFYENLLQLEPWRLDIQELITKINNRKSKDTPVTSDDKYRQAQDLVAQNDRNGAIKILQEIVSKDPDYALAHNDLGVLRYQNGEIREALTHYQKAVELDPDNIIFKKNMAEYHLFADSNITRALELYLSILKDHPYDVETLMAAATISRKVGLKDNARIFYDAILDIEPWNMEASEWLARIEREDNSSKDKRAFI